jgi:predicted acylesterase/phospholipase RssA
MDTHDHTVLVLQGGGALGAYQAGVYEGMAEQGIAPDWVTGVSIGAINGALIPGPTRGQPCTVPLRRAGRAVLWL